MSWVIAGRDFLLVMLTYIHIPTDSSQYGCAHTPPPLELHLTTSELWFGQEQEGILP